MCLHQNSGTGISQGRFWNKIIDPDKDILWAYNCTYLLTNQFKHVFNETVLLSTHNICFGWEIKKIVFQYTLLSGGLKIDVFVKYYALGTDAVLFYICLQFLQSCLNFLFSWVKPVLFVCIFFSLRPKSTAMVMAGRSVNLTTLFLGKLEKAVNHYFMHIL